MIVSNIFSFGMLDESKSVLFVEEVSLDSARQLVSSQPITSIVMHKGTAAVFSTLLKTEIKQTRSHVYLKDGESMLIGVHRGVRISDDDIYLPDGAAIKWFYVSVESDE